MSADAFVSTEPDWTPTMLTGEGVWRQRILELEAEVKFLRETIKAILEKQR